jgi:hypothetical protein
MCHRNGIVEGGIVYRENREQKAENRNRQGKCLEFLNFVNSKKRQSFINIDNYYILTRLALQFKHPFINRYK